MWMSKSLKRIELTFSFKTDRIIMSEFVLLVMFHFDSSLLLFPKISSEFLPRELWSDRKSVKLHYHNKQDCPDITIMKKNFFRLCNFQIILGIPTFIDTF